MATQSINIGHERGNETLAFKITDTNGLSPELNESIPDSSTNLEIAWAVDVSAMTFLFIVASVDMNVATNDASTGSPQEELELLAGVPVPWYTGIGYDKPFADDVTSIFVTNASGGPGTLKIFCNADATP